MSEGTEPPTEPAARLGKPFELVESAAALAAATAAWRRVPALAVDTEFVRERTFYHRLGLIQAFDGDRAYLVDPLAASDLAPVAEVFRDPDVTKILHSGSEDIEVFYHVVGTLPAPLFDTQVGAALSGVGASLGYGRLVFEVLGVELHKEETRTDWLARPLSPRQLAYAAEDVEYLLPVYMRLCERLEELGRLHWALEDSAALLDTNRFREDAEGAYLKVKGAGKLNPRQLAALQDLAAWREREARKRDLPRRFLLKEDLLLSLATRRPATMADLERVPALDRRQAAKDAETWLEILARSAERRGSDLPPGPLHLPFAPAIKELSGRLRELATAKALELQIPPEILAPRRTLDALLTSALTGPAPALPKELAGWRREVVGESLLADVQANAHRLPRLRTA